MDGSDPSPAPAEPLPLTASAPARFVRWRFAREPRTDALTILRIRVSLPEGTFVVLHAADQPSVPEDR